MSTVVAVRPPRHAPRPLCALRAAARLNGICEPTGALARVCRSAWREQEGTVELSSLRASRAMAAAPGSAAHRQRFAFAPVWIGPGQPRLLGQAIAFPCRPPPLSVSSSIDRSVRITYYTLEMCCAQKTEIASGGVLFAQLFVRPLLPT